MQPTQRIFEIAAGGVFTLPRRLLDLHDGRQRLAGHLQVLTAPEAADTVKDTLAEATITACLADAPPPAMTDAETARRAEREYADRLDTYRRALARLDQRIDTELADSRDEIITEHLRPPFTGTLEQLREAFELTAGIDSPAAAAAAPAKVRAAILTIDAHYARYTEVTVARALLRQVGDAPQRDTQGEFSLVRNVDELWPRKDRGGPFARPRPWGDGVDGLRWLLANGAELWLPTVAEQDQRYAEVYDEAEQRVARNNATLHQYRVLGTTAGAA